MQLDPKDLRVSKLQYQEILRLWDNGKIVMFIDTSAFRRFFTDSHVRNTSDLVGKSLVGEMLAIRFLMFLFEPVCVLLMLLVSVMSVGWWSLLILPIALFLWFFLKSQASIGKQRIVDAVLFLFAAIIAATSFADEDIWLQLLIISFPLLYLCTKSLYYLSARFGFNLIRESYFFFSFYYERPYDRDSFNIPMIWTEPPIKQFSQITGYLSSQQIQEEQPKKDNHWTHGSKHWQVPPLPTEWRGLTGAQLQRATFDSSVGQEIFILILESPHKAGFPKLSQPSELRLKAGRASTSYGSIIFLLWTINLKQTRLATYEQFLNPHHLDTLRLLRDFAGQPFVKALMINSSTEEVVDMVEFPNTFIDPRLLPAVQIESNKPPGNFDLARQEFQVENSIDDLLEMD